MSGWSREEVQKQLQELPSNTVKVVVALPANTVSLAKEVAAGVKENFLSAKEEFVSECCLPVDQVKSNSIYVLKEIARFIHIPYFPAFHSPGWLLRYIVGPHTPAMFEQVLNDIIAGITVGLTLIPQALSYAQLANLPPINGLYSAILPSLVYALVGSSLQLAVGPVALVSLLTGELVAHYCPDYATNTPGALDVAAQAALCCGIILTVMSILNLGRLINFISHPVMSGFTTAAACLIGLSQLKNAFGFTNKIPAVPQTGDKGFKYNYQVMRWYSIHFYDRYITHTSTNANSRYIKGDQYHHLWLNPYAVKICFGLYIPIMIIYFIKDRIAARASGETKRKLWYRAMIVIIAILPFVAIIIGAHVAWQLKHDDHYTQVLMAQNGPHHSWYVTQLKVIGALKPGLDFAKIPKIPYPMGKFIVDCIPLTLIAYMESWSVARRIASFRNELHILSASQEMWGNGVANLVASCCSGYPVSGSFSRSSLNYATGATTPLSKITTLCVVTLCLGKLTKALFYIPNAALAAVIFCAISNLINISDYWETWRHNKKDFFTIVVTTIIVFVFDTSTGLAVGIGCSILMLLSDIVLGRSNNPWVSNPRKENNGIDVIRLEADINFLSALRLKDFISSLYISPPPSPEDSAVVNEKIFRAVSNTLDKYLRPDINDGVVELPKGIVIDMAICRSIDLTGLTNLSEILHEGRAKKIKMVIINTHPDLIYSLKKFGIKSDSSSDDVNLDNYLAFNTLDLIPVKGAPVNEPEPDVEKGLPVYEVVPHDDDSASIELTSAAGAFAVPANDQLASSENDVSGKRV